MPRRRSLWWWWLMGVGLATLVVVPFTVWIGMVERQPAASGAPPQPTSLGVCTDAVAKVQQYRAPGASSAIVDALPRTLPREGTAVQPIGWQNEGGGEPCYVSFSAYISNQQRSARWRYEPQHGGRVEAVDDFTRRVSGW